MNTKTSASGRTIVISAEKITKGEIDKALADGKTHVKFKNKGVQKRMLKQQQQIRRKQELRENKAKALNKDQKAARETRSTVGGIGLAHPVTTDVSGTAHFIDKDGKRVPVSSAEAKEITKAFEADEGETEAEQADGFKMVSPFEGMGPIVKIEGEEASSGMCRSEVFPKVLLEPRKEIDPELYAAIETEIEGKEELPSPAAEVNIAVDTIPVKVPIQSYECYKAEQEGKVYLNLYGDENHYKPFPTVGKLVRDDGLVSALRTLEEGVVLTEEEKARLIDIDYVSDKLTYAGQGPYIPDPVVYKPVTELSTSDINPFNQVSPGDRTQMFQTSLIDKITGEGSNNVEAMREGLKEAGLLRNPTE